MRVVADRYDCHGARQAVPVLGGAEIRDSLGGGATRNSSPRLPRQKVDRITNAIRSALVAKLSEVGDECTSTARDHVCLFVGRLSTVVLWRVRDRIQRTMGNTIWEG